MDETQVSTAPETLNPAPELAATPEVATPESEATEQPKEPDQADKALKGLHRRIDRLTAARYQEQARATDAIVRDAAARLGIMSDTLIRMQEGQSAIKEKMVSIQIMADELNKGKQ